MNRNGRFVVILCCAIIVFFFSDYLVKQAINGPRERIRIGMSEAEAVRLAGLTPLQTTNGVKEIWVKSHDSIFDMMLERESMPKIVRIKTGMVVEIVELLQPMLK